MSTFVISRANIYLLLLAWWSIFAYLLFASVDRAYLLSLVGFPFVIFVPGFLTLTALRIRGMSFWPRVGMIVGFSVLEVILIALIGNTVLPSMGVAKPLAPFALFAEISVFVFFLFFVATAHVHDFHVSLRKYVFFDDIRAFLCAFFPIVFIVLAVLGAVSLNNGEGNIFTVVMLLCMGMYTAFLVFFANKNTALEENVIPTALYFMALALLLMTSLRGWYTTGHDIQTEFFVFQLAQEGGIWDIGAYRNAYNACMSITILPTVFAALSRLADPYIYKVFFQIIFALMAPLVYTIVRRYTAKSIALLATFYFIAFPTFFGDMPMLNRQEIAFLFWALMVYLLFEVNIRIGLRRALFVVFGLGVILSHYSTTYTVIALLISLMFVRPVVLWVVGFFKDGTFFRHSAMIPEKQLYRVKEETVATKWVVTILCLLTFLWSSVLTDTSSGSITRVLTKTFEAMRSATKEDTRSGDVFYGLFSWKKLDKKVLLQNFQEKVVTPTRDRATEGTYYATSTYEKYPIAIAEEFVGPLTVLGEVASSSGISVSQTHYFLRQVFAKILQLLIVIGFLFALLRRSYQEKVFGLEFSLLAVGSLLFVASQVLLPVLSSEYGVFRAFQQSLIFLSVLIVIGGMSLGFRLKVGTRLIVTTAFSVLFFYSMTGVMTQAVLRNPPQLHLSNSGPYYDLYYTHKGDLDAIQWVNEHIPKNSGAILQTDYVDRAELRAISGITLVNSIYPGLIQKDAYVFLDSKNTQKRMSTVVWNGDVVGYTYPVEFLDAEKELLYSNNEVRIYK